MKNTLILIMFALVSYQLKAQLSKGNFLIDGSISASSNTKDFNDGSEIVTIKSHLTSFSPKAGFFLSDKSVIGLSLAYSEYGNKYQLATRYDQYQQKEFDIGPYYRQYFPLGDHTAFFVQGLAQFRRGKTTNYSGINDREDVENFKGFNLVITPGINYFLSHKWGIEATLGSLYYNSLDSDSDESPSFSGDIKSNNVGINLNLSSFSIGIQYFINR